MGIAKPNNQSPESGMLLTRYRFGLEALRQFEAESGNQIRLDQQQEIRIQRTGNTRLSYEQLRRILRQTRDVPVPDYIMRENKVLQPISLALFVINENIWKIMARKKQHRDRLNPMITFPWFYHGSTSDGTNESRSIVKHATGSGLECVSVKDDMMNLAGQGGDFAGVLEERVVLETYSSRPIFIPRGFGSRDLISKYNLEKIRLDVDMKLCQASIYPLPDTSFDYRFSEDPEEFHTHGLAISTTGEAVTLFVSGKTPCKLRGSVMIMICKPMDGLHATAIPLRYHLWMTALQELIEAKSRV